ncbi:MAG: MFS transporter [Bdellovibrionaceae bacterium]|nr:MFS transporter [Pseudobdellovibrionaceae bacterium]
MTIREQRILNTNVIVAALGYFVDIYDLLLFGIVRVASLKAIGVSEGDLLSKGVFLINAQMVGMLLGGVLWGVLGDKKGRLSVLFGSIFLYSVANIANAFVTSVEMYGALRFVAGIGLAGELGAAITLVSETMSKEKRGYGTAVVASVGILGAVFAALVGDFFDWKTAYIIGGVMGLALLVLRVSMYESGLFQATLETDVRKGDLRMLLQPWSRFARYIRCILIGVPIWFVVGILLTFAPEIGRALGTTAPLQASQAIMYGYIGLAAGDFASGFLSQILKTRLRIVGAFATFTALVSVLMLSASGATASEYYALCTLVGFGAGYWAVFVTIAAEQFGTNLRATVTTSVPNFVRGAVVPITLSFQALQATVGIRHAGLIVGAACFAFCFGALWFMQETFGKDLDYHEPVSGSSLNDPSLGGPAAIHGHDRARHSASGGA